VTKERVTALDGRPAETVDVDRTEMAAASGTRKPRQERQASLLVVAGASSMGRIFRVDQPSMTVGRNETCDICLPEGGISRRHLRLVRDEQNNIFAIDLDSTNGTFVNDARITRHLLRDGESIRLGPDTVLKFSYRDSVEEAFHTAQYEQAIFDSVTRLFNKQYLLSKLRQELAYAIRHEEPASVVLLGVDQLPQITEILGVHAANTVMQQVAVITRTNIREEDLFTHYENEVFAVFLRGLGLPEAQATAERMRILMEGSTVLWDHEPVRITFSAGIATLGRAPLSDPQGMLAVANRGLAAARSAGGNCVAGVEDPDQPA
jgi:two-component system cell cycle response regulator